ncbi:MAG: cytochrome c family protein [Candidatus Scalindua sp.]|nr:cytochrome c family protein [Candidatus Scalindua sp.]
MNIYPELVKRGAAFPGSERCGDCHIAIYKEWADSLHAQSYVNEEFRTSSGDYEFQFCLSCHVPETVLTESQEIKPRSHNVEDGVDCQGCHLTSDCYLSGPHSGIGPHPIKKNEALYKDSKLCGKCHIGTYEEYLRYVNDEKKETCQDCHMPAVKRKLIQDEPWQKIHKRKEGKAHTFSRADAMEAHKDFVELSFSEIKKTDNLIAGRVKIRNILITHSVPTGDYGYREVLLLINLKNNFGRIVRSRHESMFVELGTQLKPMEKREYFFSFAIDEIAEEITDLEAILYRTDFKRTNKTVLAKAGLSVDN